MGIAVENDGEGLEKTSATFGAFMGNGFIGDEDITDVAIWLEQKEFNNIKIKIN